MGAIGDCPPGFPKAGMSSKSKTYFEQVKQPSAHDAAWDRENLVRILFVHRPVANVERCLDELTRIRWTGEAAAVPGHPSPTWQET